MIKPGVAVHCLRDPDIRRDSSDVCGNHREIRAIRIILASWPGPGTTPPFQFARVFQSPDTEPLQSMASLAPAMRKRVAMLRTRMEGRVCMR